MSKLILVSLLYLGHTNYIKNEIYSFALIARCLCITRDDVEVSISKGTEPTKSAELHQRKRALEGTDQIVLSFIRLS